MAWAPDDSLLASCSVDNFILIWRVPVLDQAGSGLNAGTGFSGASGAAPLLLAPERRLSGHASWVKGLAWDPMGTYLASAAEDKTVRGLCVRALFLSLWRAIVKLFYPIQK